MPLAPLGGDEADMFGCDEPIFGEGSFLDDEADLDDGFTSDQDLEDMDLEDVVGDFDDEDDEQ